MYALSCFKVRKIPSDECFEPTCESLFRLSLVVYSIAMTHNWNEKFLSPLKMVTITTATTYKNSNFRLEMERSSFNRNFTAVDWFRAHFQGMQDFPWRSSSWRGRQTCSRESQRAWLCASLAMLTKFRNFQRLLYRSLWEAFLNWWSLENYLPLTLLSSMILSPLFSQKLFSQLQLMPLLQFAVIIPCSKCWQRT